MIDREAQKDFVKGKIEEYLQSKGINTSKPFYCLNPAHNDRKPSMSLDRRNLRAHCFSCGAKYDIFDLIGMDNGITDSGEIFKKAYEMYGVDANQTGTARRREDQEKRKAAEQERDFTEVTDAAHRALLKDPQALAHFTQRGFSRDLINAYRMGYAPQGHNSLLSAYPEIQTKSRKARLYKYVLPFIDEDDRVRYFQTEIIDRDQVDDYNGKYRKINGITAPLFNERYLRSNTPAVVFLVEGIMDAYSIEEVGGKAIALQGAGGDTRFIDCIKRYAPDTTIVFYMDKDGAGAGYCDRITKALPDMRHIVRWPQNGKDANEELTRNRASFEEAVMMMTAEAQDEKRAADEKAEKAEEELREKYLNSSAAGYLQQFVDGISASVDTEAIPTGIDSLDQVLDGGLYEGLITVGGISSLGKTSLIMQIADQIAASGQDVLIISLEMARAELMAKSISRHTLDICLKEKIDTRNAKTARGITAGKRWQNYRQQEVEIIQRAIRAYGEYADHLYIMEGVGDITAETVREKVRQHILFTGGILKTDENTGKESIEGGRRPILIVDYLQIMAPYDVRATDKQNTDKAVLELKRISRDYKIPVIAISSFNRAGYKEAVTFEQLKESGSIEYSSDIVVGLQLKGAGKREFDPTEAKKKDPREIELVILKNRQGAVGDKVVLNYYPMFNYFIDGGITD